MRKIISFLLILCILCAITACGNASGGIPNNTSEGMYEIGLAALETVDEYLDGSLDIETARDRISSSYSHADAQYEEDKEEVGDNLQGTEYSNDYFIHHEILMLSYEMMKKDYGSGTSKVITDARNDLAGYLNEKSR